MPQRVADGGGVSQQKIGDDLPLGAADLGGGVAVEAHAAAPGARSSRDELVALGGDAELDDVVARVPTDHFLGSTVGAEIVFVVHAPNIGIGPNPCPGNSPTRLWNGIRVVEPEDLGPILVQLIGRGVLGVLAAQVEAQFIVDVRSEVLDVAGGDLKAPLPILDEGHVRRVVETRRLGRSLPGPAAPELVSPLEVLVDPDVPLVHIRVVDGVPEIIGVGAGGLVGRRRQEGSVLNDGPRHRIHPVRRDPVAGKRHPLAVDHVHRIVDDPTGPVAIETEDSVTFVFRW